MTILQEDEATEDRHSAAQLRLMLEGKLTELDKQPQNVQAVVTHSEEEGGASTLSLQDEDGSFLEVLLEAEDHELSEEEEESGAGDDLREQCCRRSCRLPELSSRESGV